MTARAGIITDLSRIKYELEKFLLGGALDLYEDERLIASIEPVNCGTEVSYQKLILSCWGDGWSRSWRVIDCEPSADALRLRCSKQMGRAECRIELRRGPAAHVAAESRAEFTQKIAAMIESSFSGLRVERAITARDDRQHFSGAHTRLVVEDRSNLIAGIAVSERESQSDIDAALGGGIIWLDAMRRKTSMVNRLMIFAPRERATTIATRLTAASIPGASVSLHEVNEADNIIEQIAAFDQGDLNDRLKRAAFKAVWPRETRLAPDVEALVDQIVKLAPAVIETQPRGSRVGFLIRGLEFARLFVNRKQVEFGLGEARKRLDENNRPELDALVAEIVAGRSSDCAGRSEFLFRAQAERWLESIIRRDVTQIAASLDPRCVYSQVPAYRGEQRSFIDLLAVTRAGRLVVIELKVAEDPEFPFQGLDYWLRVEWHRLRGDFQRRGYFKDLKIADAAPLLYLVAPLFRFHATTKLIAGSIHERVPVYRVGINDDWRSDVRVLLTERLNGEK